MELKDLKDILELIICVLGVIIPLVFLIKEHYDKKKTETCRASHSLLLFTGRSCCMDKIS